MRVLVVDEAAPWPPDSGKRIRTWELLLGKILAAVIPALAITIASAAVFVIGILAFAVTDRVRGIIVTPGWILAVLVDAPLLALIGVALIPVLIGQKIVGSFRNTSTAVTQAVEASGWSRREFLRFAGAMAPPVLTFGLTGIAMAQLNNVRVRRFVLPISKLPKELAGSPSRR